MSGSDPARAFAGFDRPALLVTGTLDGQPIPGIGVSPDRRLATFAAMPPSANKFLLVVDKADHMYFNGTRGLRDQGALGHRDTDFAAVETLGYPLVKAVSTAYWETYLRADAAALRWLKEGGAAALVATKGSFKNK